MPDAPPPGLSEFDIDEPEPTVRRPPPVPSQPDSDEDFATAAPPTVRPPTTRPGAGRPPFTSGSTPSLDVPYPHGYDILGELGRGGMGVVYHARHAKLNREVALKMILPADDADRKATIRFLAESEAVAAVRHPNVVQVYDYGDVRGRPYLAMEYLDGGTLSGKLRAGRLDPAEAAALVAKLARGAAAAHARQIVHRDLKPANVLFGADGEPRLADFGLAKLAGSDLTQTQAVMGTPLYMAPEQASGQAKFVGPPADVWALGVILYEAVTGVRPFAGDTTFQLMQQVMHADPAAPGTHVSGLPRDLERVCLKCLQKVPADRYPTAKELADDLDRFARGEAVSVVRPGPVERAARWARRKPTLAAAYGFAVLAAVLCGFGLGVFYLYRLQKDITAQVTVERDHVETERMKAEAATAKAEASEATVAVADYARTVDLAYQSLKAGQTVRAAEVLATTRPDLRGFEWHLLRDRARPPHLALRGHLGAVFAVAARPTGGLIASGGQDGSVRLWDAATGAEVAKLTDAKGPVYAVAWAADGRLAAGGEDGVIRIYDADTRKLLRGIPGFDNEDLFCLAFSPDGKALAAVSHHRTAQLYDPATGSRITALVGHTQEVYAVAWSADGQRLATGGKDGTVRIWDAKTKQSAETAPAGPKAGVAGLAFGPAGRVIVGRFDGAVFGIADGKWQTIDIAGPAASEVAVTGSGKWLAVGRADGRVDVYDYPRTTEPVTPRRQIAAHAGRVASVGFNADGTTLVTGGEDGLAKVWATVPTELAEVVRSAARPGEPPAVEFVPVPDRPGVRPVASDIGFADPVAAVAVTPDGRHVVLGRADGQVVVRPTGGAIGPVEPGPLPVTPPVLPAMPPPAGPRPVPSRKNESRWEERRDWFQVRFQPTPPETAMAAPREADPSFPALLPAGVRGLAVGPDGKWVLIASQKAGPQLWTPPAAPVSLVWPPGEYKRPKRSTGRLAAPDADDPNEPTAAAADPQGKWVAVARADGRIVLWNPADRTPLGTLDGHGGPVPGLAASPDGRWLASAGFDGTARVWDVAARTPITVYRNHAAVLLSVAFSPDGKWVASGGGCHTVRVWEPATGAERFVLRGHTGPVSAVAFMPDGSRIVSGGFDKTLRFWDAGRGVELLGLDLDGVVRSVAVTADGTRVLAGTSTGAKAFARGLPTVALFP